VILPISGAFDFDRRKVMELRDDNRQQVPLDLSNLPEGLYSVQIRTMEMQGVWNIVVNR
jgi:hypothetical protein